MVRAHIEFQFFRTLIRLGPTAVEHATIRAATDPMPGTTQGPMSYAGVAKLPAPLAPSRSMRIEPSKQLGKRGCGHPASTLACQACYCAGRKVECEGGHCARCKKHNFACTYQRCPYDPECIKKDCSLYHAGQLSTKELRTYNLLRSQFRNPGEAYTDRTACKKI